jgi:N-acetylmuramoyl-L-alanine amidase CwlA
VANPGSTAMANRNYFNSSDSTTSSHFIVGLEGEVILCVPLDEKSSATNERNLDTISIEVCHPDETGEFSPDTYASLIRLLSWLCEEFELGREDIIRHYDVTGKLCPKYYVEHPEAWEALKNQVKIKEKE